MLAVTETKEVNAEKLLSLRRQISFPLRVTESERKAHWNTAQNADGYFPRDPDPACNQPDDVRRVAT